jgi:hypothetical protein
MLTWLDKYSAGGATANSLNWWWFLESRFPTRMDWSWNAGWPPTATGSSLAWDGVQLLQVNGGMTTLQTIKRRLRAPGWQALCERLCDRRA